MNKYKHAKFWRLIYVSDVRKVHYTIFNYFKGHIREIGDVPVLYKCEQSYSINLDGSLLLSLF